MALTREKIFKEFKEIDEALGMPGSLGAKFTYLQELKEKLNKKDNKLDINVDALIDYYTKKYCK
jgi:hypothetical protein